MRVQFILTEYVDQALSQALYDKLEDGTFAGQIPPCKGVVAFGATLRECQDELRSTLEDWILRAQAGTFLAGVRWHRPEHGAAA